MPLKKTVSIKKYRTLKRMYNNIAGELRGLKAKAATKTAHRRAYAKRWYQLNKDRLGTEAYWRRRGLLNGPQ